MTHTLIDIETLRTLCQLTEYVRFRNAESVCPPAAQVAGALTTAEELIATPVKPTVVANISGGLLQGASADYPVDLYTLDFEDADDNVIEVEGSDAQLGQCSTLVDPKFVAEVVEAAETVS
jgi:hypothetical protein